MSNRDSKIPWQVVARHLEASCSRNAGGGVSWSGTWLEDCLLMLTVFDGFDADMCTADRRTLIWDAVNACAKRGRITGEHIHEAMRDALGLYMRKSEERFVYVGQLSVGQVRKPVVFRLRKATLTITQHLPRQFDRSFLEQPRRFGTVAADSGEYAWARVHVYARTAAEAQYRAADALDFYRGAANLTFVGNIWSALSLDGARPLNALLLGPCCTLHRPNGAPASEQYWYDPHHRKYATVSCGSDKWRRAHAVALTMRKQIGRSKYGDELYRTMIRYCRTLDSGDPGVTILRLWGLLEFLTGSVRDRNDELIKRASGLFHESEVVRGTLEVLRQRRNRIAHAGTEDESEREDAVMLNRIVVRGVLLAYQKSAEYSGMEEIGRFLALPSSKSELQRGIKIRKDAIRFRGRG